MQGEGSEAAAHELSAEALAEEIARWAAEKKAHEIVEIDLRGMAAFTDRFVICSGNTERQTKAIHDAILGGLRSSHGLRPRRVEGLSQSHWILMDYLDVVVHIFTPQTREFYRLEALWGEAPTRRFDEPAGALA
jgi:ribosome-associated protein